MGSSPNMLAAATRELILVRGAPRVDLNAGCPAAIVAGKGRDKKGPSKRV